MLVWLEVEWYCFDVIFCDLLIFFNLVCVEDFDV